MTVKMNKIILCSCIVLVLKEIQTLLTASDLDFTVMLGSAESEEIMLIRREIIFQEFQSIWSRYLIVTDGRMERQLALAIPRSISR